jgi:hypothetical protein
VSISQKSWLDGQRPEDLAYLLDQIDASAVSNFFSARRRAMVSRRRRA